MLSYKDIINKIDQLEEANILLSALVFNVFSVLEKKSLPVKQVASLTKTKLEGMEVLLNALAAMGVLNKNKNIFRNTPVTYKYFCKSSPDFRVGTVMLKLDSRGEYENFSKIIKKGRNHKEFESKDDPKFRKLFTYAMYERSELSADKVADAVSQKRVGKLLDLGCGPGSYTAAILKKDKTATATLMDRAVAIKVARKIYKTQSVYNRLHFVSGDFFDDEFGEGYDTVLLSNIIHIYNVKENKIIFKKINKALKRGGRFVLYDLFLNNSKTGPYDAALFAITMLLYTKTGKSYAFGEVDSLLRNAGFARIKKTRIGDGSSIIEAIKI
ncbi:acetylserotonin O-methyltransferase [Nitrospinaceae bacterium]|nr:acetylserotonin O-methyltransferase [Nitrospinaceae bacterium]